MTTPEVDEIPEDGDDQDEWEVSQPSQEPQPEHHPESFWISTITSHDVRLEKLNDGDYDPTLRLYFRTQWSDPSDKTIGRSWEPETTFDDDSDILYDYVASHYRSIQTAIVRAQEINPEMDLDPPKYYHRVIADRKKKKEELEMDSASDDSPSENDDTGTQESVGSQLPTQQYGERTKGELDDMFAEAGGEDKRPKPKGKRKKSSTDTPADTGGIPTSAAPADSISITFGSCTKVFPVTVDGTMINTVTELCESMCVVPEPDVFLYLGRYLADLNNDHFVVSLDVINTEVTLKLAGRASEPDPEVASSPIPQARPQFTSPYPAGQRNSFVLPHREVHNSHSYIVYTQHTLGSIPMVEVPHRNKMATTKVRIQKKMEMEGEHPEAVHPTRGSPHVQQGTSRACQPTSPTDGAGRTLGEGSEMHGRLGCGGGGPRQVPRWPQPCRIKTVPALRYS